MSVNQEGVYRFYLQPRPYYNIAYAVECQEDGRLVVMLAGVVIPAVEAMFAQLCRGGVGIAKSYAIERRYSPVWRNGVLSEWLEVTLDGFDPTYISEEMAMKMMEQWLRRGLRVRLLDRYIVDDFLNLTRHSADLAINNGTPRRSDRRKDSETEMANIYIKVPWYVAWHFRGRDERRQLTEWDAVKFTEFDHEYRTLVNNLRFIPEAQQTRMCFSQQAWKNILHGRKPEGGQIILQRDPKTWPTVNETAALTGIQMSSKHISSDYLCVEIPKESIIAGKMHRTNSCYSLSYDAAFYFSAMLTDRFSYEYTQWMDQDQRNGIAQGFRRKISESQERYFVQYNFPVDIDPSLRESLRRSHTRFIERGRGKPRYCYHFGQESQEYMEHVGEHEEKRREEAEKQQKREAKKNKG